MHDLKLNESIYILFIITFFALDLYVIGKLISQHIGSYLFLVLLYLIYYWYCIWMYNDEPGSLCTISIKVNTSSDSSNTNTDDDKTPKWFTYLNENYHLIPRKYLKKHNVQDSSSLPNNNPPNNLSHKSSSDNNNEQSTNNNKQSTNDNLIKQSTNNNEQSINNNEQSINNNLNDNEKQNNTELINNEQQTNNTNDKSIDRN